MFPYELTSIDRWGLWLCAYIVPFFPLLTSRSSHPPPPNVRKWIHRSIKAVAHPWNKAFMSEEGPGSQSRPCLRRENKKERGNGLLRRENKEYSGANFDGQTNAKTAPGKQQNLRLSLHSDVYMALEIVWGSEGVVCTAIWSLWFVRLIGVFRSLASGRPIFVDGEKVKGECLLTCVAMLAHDVACELLPFSGRAFRSPDATT